MKLSICENDSTNIIFGYMMTDSECNVGISEQIVCREELNKKQIQDVINTLENALLIAKLQHKKMFFWAGENHAK